MPPTAPAAREVLAYFESLRRISLNLSSSMELNDVLQSIVDSICDHTPWKLCWIYAVDVEGGYGETIARCDRLNFTETIPSKRWKLNGDIAVEALRRNDIIAVPDSREAADYPSTQEFARDKGIIAAVSVPLRSMSPTGGPMVLCVHSAEPILEDPVQVAFVRAVAAMVSLAVSNASLLDDTRRVATLASKAASLLMHTTDAVTSGEPSNSTLSSVEVESGQTIIVFDNAGRVRSAGTVPPSLGLRQEEWVTFLQGKGSAIFEEASAALDSDTALVPLDLPNVGQIKAHVSRFGQADGWSFTVLFIGWSPANESSQHVAASAATAMVLLRDRLAAESQSMLQRDTLIQILKGKIGDTYEFATRAGLAGIQLDSDHYLVVARSATDGVSESPRDTLSYGLRSALLQWPGAVMQTLHGTHVMLLPATDPRIHDLKAFIQAIVRLGGKSSSLSVTSSNVLLPFDRIPADWRRCQQTLQLAHKFRRAGFIDPDEFGANRLLLSAMSSADIEEFVSNTIGPLLQQNEGRDGYGDSFLTAEAFVNAGGRFQEASRRLCIHVSTLRYRLHRINELLGCDLAEEEARFNVLLAIRIERLRSGTPSKEM